MLGRYLDCNFVESHSSIPTAMSKGTFTYMSLFKAPSTLALNAFKDGVSTSSLHNLFLCLTKRRHKCKSPSTFWLGPA